MTLAKETSEHSLNFEESYVTIPRPNDTTASSSYSEGQNEDTSTNSNKSPPDSNPHEGEDHPTTCSNSYMNEKEKSLESKTPGQCENLEILRKDQEDRARLLGAGVVAAVITLPILGPGLATAAGIAAAYGSTQSGAAGDACRAAGDVALTAKDKVKEINQKHDIVNQTKNGAQGILSKLRDVNGRHEIFERVKKMLSGTAKGISEAFKSIAEKLNKRGDEKCESKNNNVDVQSG
jgi:hypothetical protein